MSTETDLQRIIKKLKQRIAETDQFNDHLKKEMAEIDGKLEKMKHKKRNPKPN